MKHPLIIMNKIYRCIYNKTQKMFVMAPQAAKSNGDRGASAGINNAASEKALESRRVVPKLPLPTYTAAVLLPLFAFSSAAMAQQINADGTTVIANGHYDTASFGEAALRATNGGTIEGTSVHIEVLHESGIAANAKEHGVIALRNGLVQGTLTNSFGLSAESGGLLKASDTDVFLAGADSVGVWTVYDNGKIELERGKVIMSGDRSRGLAVGNVNQTNSGSLEANGVEVVTFGDDSVGAEVAHGRMELGAGTTLTTLGLGSAGARVLERGSLEMNGGSISTEGQMSAGVVATADGHAAINGVAIDTRGDDSQGAAASYGGSVALSGGSVATRGDRAAGLSAVGQQAAQRAIVTAENVQVQTSGSYSHGVVLGAGGQAELRGSDIAVSGEASDALFSWENGSTAVNTATVVDSRLSSTQGVAIHAYSGPLNATVTDSTLHGGSGLLQVENAAALNLIAVGSALTGQALTDATSTSHVTLQQGSTWTVTGNSALTSLTNDSSTVAFAPPGSGGFKTLRVGDYSGSGGRIVLNTVLDGDNSPTDRVVVDGGKATGSTGLVIKRAGGEGARTTQGIRVVETVNGGQTEQQAFALDAASDGYRGGAGTIVAGAYDYRLRRGGDGGVAQDWYLVSGKSPAPLAPQPPGDDTPPVQGTDTPQYRPEVGAYLNNKLAASAMQMHTLSDRQGQAMGPQGQNGTAPAAWIRISASSDRRDGVADLKDRSTSYLVHGGSDILHVSDGGDGTFRFGAMAAYGTNSSTATNGDLSAKGSVDGLNAGLYGTWYGNRNTAVGPYVDTWAMYGWFKNKVEGDGLPKENYNSNALSGSVEAGYGFKVYDNGDRQVYVQPQAQAIWTGYRANTHTEDNGTRVGDSSQNSVSTRLGVQVQGYAEHVLGMTQVRPFVQANWWHGPSSQRIAFDYDRVSEQLPTNRFELKVGLQGNVSKAVSVWTSLGLEKGGSDYSSARGQIGVKYVW